MLDFSRLVKKLGCNCTNLRIFERLDNILDPIGLVCLYVVVEKNQPFSSGCLRAKVALLGKVKRFVVGYEMNRCTLGIEDLERLRQLGIRHDHQFEVRIFRRSRQLLEAGARTGGRIRRHND